MRALWPVTVAAVVAAGALAVTAALGPSSPGAPGAPPPAVLLERGPVLPAAALPLLEAGRAFGTAGAARLVLPGPPGRPEALAFFASWCPSCRADLLALVHAQARLGRRVRLVGIDVNDSAGPALSLLRDVGARFAVGEDPTARYARALGLEGLPDLVVVGPDRRVEAVVRGPISASALVALLGRVASFGGTRTPSSAQRRS